MNAFRYHKYFPSLISKSSNVTKNDFSFASSSFFKIGSAGRRRARAPRGRVRMCRRPDRVPGERGNHGDGNGRRHAPLLELPEENPDRRALPEVPAGKVIKRKRSEDF